MSALAPSPTLPLAPSLLQQARERYARVRLAEQCVGDAFTSLSVQTWHFGAVLLRLRDDRAIKGKWALFLEANFPDLGRAKNPGLKQDPEALAKSRANRASEAIKFYLDNPPVDSPTRGILSDLEQQPPATFTIDSLRACFGHQIPEKERAQLEGNEPVNRQPTPLTFVNHLVQFSHRVSAKLATPPDLETARRDFAPALPLIADLVGRDYLLAQIQALPEPT